MSEISDTCRNYGKHDGTSHYWMCHRCVSGLVEGCADFRTEGQSYMDRLRENSVVFRFKSKGGGEPNGSF